MSGVGEGEKEFSEIVFERQGRQSCRGCFGRVRAGMRAYERDTFSYPVNS